jgi:hypothetical protein
MYVEIVRNSVDGQTNEENFIGSKWHFHIITHQTSDIHAKQQQATVILMHVPPSPTELFSLTTSKRLLWCYCNNLIIEDHHLLARINLEQSFFLSKAFDLFWALLFHYFNNLSVIFFCVGYHFFLWNCLLLGVFRMKFSDISVSKSCVCLLLWIVWTCETATAFVSPSGPSSVVPSKICHAPTCLYHSLQDEDVSNNSGWGGSYRRRKRDM